MSWGMFGQAVVPTLEKALCAKAFHAIGGEDRDGDGDLVGLTGARSGPPESTFTTLMFR